MKTGKSYYALDLRYLKHRKVKKVSERNAIREAHGVDQNKRYATREEADAANPDTKVFEVSKCTPLFLGVGGF